MKGEDSCSFLQLFTMVELLPFPSITQIGSESRRGCEQSDIVLRTWKRNPSVL